MGGYVEAEDVIAVEAVDLDGGLVAEVDELLIAVEVDLIGISIRAGDRVCTAGGGAVDEVDGVGIGRAIDGEAGGDDEVFDGIEAGKAGGKGVAAVSIGMGISAGESAGIGTADEIGGGGVPRITGDAECIGIGAGVEVESNVTDRAGEVDDGGIGIRGAGVGDFVYCGRGDGCHAVGIDGNAKVIATAGKADAVRAAIARGAAAGGRGHGKVKLCRSG